MNSIIKDIEPIFEYNNGKILKNGEINPNGNFRCKQINKDVCGEKVLDINNTIYGAMLYEFDITTGKTINVFGNKSIAELFLNKLAYKQSVMLDYDPVSPVKYKRKIFKNIVVQYDDDCYIVLSILNPINSKPFIKNPSNQICVYICLASTNISNYTYEGFTGNHIGFINCIDGINIVSDSGHIPVYPIPHISILSKHLTDIIYAQLKNVLSTHVSNTNYILGSQTLGTVSVLWSHIHVLLLDEHEILNNISTEILQSYINEKKFIKPFKRDN